MHARNLHIYPSDFKTESRLMRETAAIEALNIFNDVVMYGVSPTNQADTIHLSEKRRVERYPRAAIYAFSAVIGRSLATLSWFWNLYKALKAQSISCVHAHSLPTLPFCIFVKYWKGAKLVYDTHELETETITSHGLKRAILKTLEFFCIRHADAVMCVGAQIADWYAATYQIPRPFVMRNIPAYIATDTGINLRETFDIPSDKIIFLAHGILAEGRGLERIVTLFQTLPQHHIVFLGRGTLVPFIQAASHAYPHIHYHPEIPITQVIHTASSADVGFSNLWAACLSYKLSLPNKLFEYIYAGLPVLVGPMPEQQALVSQYNIGWQLPDDDKAAHTLLSGLTKADIAIKKAGLAHAQADLQWAQEAKIIESLFLMLFPDEKRP